MEIDPIQMALLLQEKLALFLDELVFWFALKFFLLVYVAVLLVDIILLLVLKGLSGDLKKTLYGTERPLQSKSTIIKRYEAILERLEGINPSQYKVALLEADALADEILDSIGYKGATMAEKLEAVEGSQLESKSILFEAHTVRNQIIHDPHFVLSQEEAKRLVGHFRQFFDEVELF